VGKTHQPNYRTACSRPYFSGQYPATQVILRRPNKSQTLHRIHKSPKLFYILSQMNPMSNFPTMVSILIYMLWCHLRPDLENYFLPQGIPTKILCAILPFAISGTVPAPPKLHLFIIRTFGKMLKSWFYVIQIHVSLPLSPFLTPCSHTPSVLSLAVTNLCTYTELQVQIHSVNVPPLCTLAQH